MLLIIINAYAIIVAIQQTITLLNNFGQRKPTFVIHKYKLQTIDIIV